MVHQFRVIRFLFRKKLEGDTNVVYVPSPLERSGAIFTRLCLCERENESHGQVQEVKFCFISR